MHTVGAHAKLRDRLDIKLVERENPEPAPRADVRQCQDNGQNVLVFRSGVVVSTLHWESANLLGQALTQGAARAHRDSQYVLVVKNGVPIAELHRDYARELGSELIRVAEQCEGEHWNQVERKLGRPVPIKRAFGIPVLESPEQMERLGGS